MGTAQQKITKHIKDAEWRIWKQDVFSDNVSLLNQIKLIESYRNDQQDAIVQDNLLFHCSLTAEHVSSDIIAYHQELLIVITASGFTHVCHCRPLSAAGNDKRE